MMKRFIMPLVISGAAEGCLWLLAAILDAVCFFYKKFVEKRSERERNI